MPESAEMSGLMLASLAAAAYGLLVIGLLCAVQPVRRALFREAAVLMRDPQWNIDERREIELMLSTSMSFGVSLLLPVAIASVAIDIILDRPDVERPQTEALDTDPRQDRFALMWFLSVSAANPIMAMFNLLLLASVMSLTALFRGMGALRSWRGFAEEPLRRAAFSVAVRHGY